MLVVLGVIAVALVFFVTEVVPIDVTAIGIMVAMIVLEPWTQISPADGLAGFSSPATITVLAMFIMSEGVRRTGLLRILGDRIVEWGRGSFFRQYATVMGLAGGSAGVINNTPVVAMMIPMVMNIAQRTRTSPSKLLMPLSFMAMMGGMLTLIGTSTSILASDVSARLIGQPFSMFEFTHLGALVTAAGGAYLLFVGYRLIPERVKPTDDLTDDFQMGEFLSEVVVREDSPLVGQTVGRVFEKLHLDVDIVQIIRDRQPFPAPVINKEFRAGDVLMLRTNRPTLVDLMASQKLDSLAQVKITDEDFGAGESSEVLVELVLLSDNPLVGETLRSVRFAQRYDALVLAIRRSGATIQERIDEMVLEGGDTLLVQASPSAMARFTQNRTFIVVQDRAPDVRREKIGIALAVFAGVIVVAALDLLPIVVAALVGVPAMLATGCIRPTELYGAVDWSVIFLLAGVIPLGMALERTGGAAYLAHLFAGLGENWPPFLLLLLFYLFTALITEVISNNASVVLMIPVAVDAAVLTGANPFAFVMAVTFAASTAMLTPVGYQTNLMVYGPGGYHFTDFFRVGGPLQVLLAIVTCGGIYMIWGL
ncbi:SLC13 family permease [Longibacter salinarum]|uniref:SLC13 family permease n=2 Tax=Longibacter salinarum TaxID=1850348 RepID=A0A2A8CVS6_9BACT|nr:SLC13 family permease [Longibacter salinarum]